MTMDNLIGSSIATPFHVETRNVNMREGGITMGSFFASQWGRFRPTPELANYRTPIKNLYLCSSVAHPGGGIGRGSGYICFKVIAEDYALPKIWEEKGRPY
jgi:phytoene dehydrogenase-like protein